MLGTQIPSIQGIGASNFHIWQWNLGRWLKKLSLEGFQEGHEDAYDISHQSMFFNYLSYLLAKFKELPIELYTLQLIVGFHGLSTYAPVG
jgi:hypothetical protein